MVVNIELFRYLQPFLLLLNILSFNKFNLIKIIFWTSLISSLNVYPS